jgi:glycosyltransferase involved in cell wall biosynthesis
VASVLQQSFENLEFIIVDDRSTDMTADIVASIKDPRLILLRNEFNRCRHPRNTAIRRARGRYVAFQNSDDVWEPTKLEAQINAMSSDASLGAVFTAVSIIDDSGKVQVENQAAIDFFRPESHSRRGWLNRFFVRGNCVAIPSALVRLDLFKRVGGFDVTLFQVSDFDLWIRLAALAPLSVLPEPLTRLRFLQGGKNLSAYSPAVVRRTLREMLVVLSRYIQSPIFDEVDQIFHELGAGDLSGSHRIFKFLQLAEFASTLPDLARRQFALSLFARALQENESASVLSQQQRSRVANRLFELQGLVPLGFGTDLPAT